MIQLYRIAKAKYARDLAGEGARLAGGRWNQQGTPVLYTADSTALATLEVLVHTPIHLVPQNLALVTFSLPEPVSIEILNPKDLPANWASYPAPSILAELGSQWADRRRSLALGVPSSITPQGEGRNYLLNPRHPEFPQVEILAVVPYEFDRRLHRQ